MEVMLEVVLVAVIAITTVAILVILFLCCCYSISIRGNDVTVIVWRSKVTRLRRVGRGGQETLKTNLYGYVVIGVSYNVL